jgi:hypothetical protein
MRQLATLCVSAAGGVLVLLQAGYLAPTLGAGLIVGAYGLAAAVALFGQDKLVAALERGERRSRPATVFLAVAFALFGAGTGMLIEIVL